MRTQELKWYSPFEKLPKTSSTILAKTDREGLILLKYDYYNGSNHVPCFYYYDAVVDCEMEYPVIEVKEWAEM